MVTTELWNAIKRICESLVATVPQPRRGVVQSVNPATMQARVLIQPEGLLSGWLPIAGSVTGNGYGILFAPLPGSQVLVIPTDMFVEGAVVVASHWSVLQPPPSGYAAGEYWLVSQTGSFIKIKNDGTIEIEDQSGTLLTFNNNGTATLSGDLNVTGTITALYNTPNSVGVTTHKHNQGVDSHGDTEQPTDSPTPGT